MNVRWLSRDMQAPGPNLCLCLSEEEYVRTLRQLSVRANGSWVSSGANATTHQFSREGGLACVVCLAKTEGRSGVEIAGILVHEAVHIWQAWCEFYGEDTPGAEQEAYAVQYLAHTLMQEYARRLA
jgi:hypothetical protein